MCSSIRQFNETSDCGMLKLVSTIMARLVPNTCLIRPNARINRIFQADNSAVSTGARGLFSREES